MRASWLVASLWFALVGSPAFAGEALEPQVAEIERLGATANWRQTADNIQALSPRLEALSREQRQRVEFVRLRMLALSGDESGAIQGLSALLQDSPLPAALRVRAYSTAISVAANVEQWVRAFTWLDEALGYLDEAPEESARLLGVASYVYSLVGETGKARELAMRELSLVEERGDGHGRCMALTHIATAEELSRRFRDAEHWHRRQIEACTRAGDMVFAANGKYGVGRMLAAQGLHGEALRWFGQALAEYEKAGYAAGQWDSRQALAGSLIDSGRDLDRAGKLLTDILRYYRGRNADSAVAETEGLLARLAEKRRQWLLWGGIGGLLLAAILLTALLRHTALERRRYRWQSEHDGLTRLYNYQQVHKLGEAAFAAARKRGRPFTAIVADVDRFKGVNDHFGHAAGDETLRSLGTWIAEVVGDGGIAGRSGGDEFMILVEGDASHAEALLQRLRERIEPITVFGRTVHFSISSGICEASEQARTLEQLVHEADQALYRAKHAGRNRVVRAGGDEPRKSGPASLVVVGSGIDFGRHASERCLSEIREAERVFCLVNPMALAMISSLRPDAINLGLHYAPGKDRRETYREIDERIMTEVRAGKRVCAVFYGHPGVFADVPHAVVRKARAEGIPARMEPGISAEACLYADLGLDPGRRGVQSMEATHFLVYDRRIDSAGLVLLWQVALAGDLTCARFHAEREGLKALVDKLLRWYPPDHEVILYEAAWLPIEQPRMERLALRELPDAKYAEYTTLVIPPLGRLEKDTTAGLLRQSAAEGRSASTH
ncbi:diguanylate cyclase [Rubrivivax gelatinosus]|uniref:diguanylate cyclase n=1 Tax=Rubrivivax gelatinosus TaxID=28068 RepID=UPI0009DAE805|nr:diguanylate cyclase [Rubrivivax gelatinosus]